jgi:Ca2+-transporting ATPase
MSLVLRDGHNVIVPASEIVIGDVLLLQTGDRVTADARILTAIDVVVNESALTGESLPIGKAEGVLSATTPLAERVNMLYTGTSIVGGRAKAVVVATGVNTELAHIASLVEETQETKTPLQAQLSRLASALALLVLALVGVLFVFGLWSSRQWLEMLELSVALAVAAIPEGLVISVTVILAIGMQRILHRKSLVRRLVAAETLGSVSVICTDKTGTITQGEMRVTHLVTPRQTWTYPFPLSDDPDDDMRKMFEVMALCNDTALLGGVADPLRGSPTERALMSAVLEQKLDVRTLAFHLPRVWEIPFDSAFKYMVTAHAQGKKVEVFLKGAPDVVLPLCSNIQIEGTQTVLTAVRRDELQSEILTYSRQGIRLIAMAVRLMSTTDQPLSRDHLEGFTFLGLVGLRDPLRPQVREQIAATASAGIRTILMTGDHPETARAIGGEAGLEAGPEAVATGKDLDTWSDEELKNRVSLISIFARVEPRHKIRIVQAWQQRGEVVAVTGDGVNDAPALKAADIGVAVGSGTEVAKQASDMVILDNNLGTITAAIEEGRVIFDNVRKTTAYLLAGSFTEVLLVGGSLFLGLPLPLLAVQILWINLATDTLPAIGLTMEPAEKGLMQQPPRSRAEPVLDVGMRRLIFRIAVITNVGLFALYVWLLASSSDLAFIQTMMFAAVGIDTLIYVFCVKSFRRSIFRINPISNPSLLLGVGMGLALLLIVLLTPFFQLMFHSVPLTLPDLGLLLIMGVAKMLVIELTKEVFLLYEKTPHIQASS